MNKKPHVLNYESEIGSANPVDIFETLAVRGYSANRLVSLSVAQAIALLRRDFQAETEYCKIHNI